MKILQEEKVKSYLEIGSKFGGSLWAVAQALPPGSTLVSVDLPWGDRSTEPVLTEVCSRIAEMGHIVHLIIGDSTDRTVIADVKNYAPFDACLIDANHTASYVRSDWDNYGPMCRIVAFHDIGWKPRPAPSSKRPIEVPEVWNEIKHFGIKYKEIKLCPQDNGFGVLWQF